MKPIAAALSLLPLPALAEAPVVIADTPIMHSLATRIAQGTAVEPALLLSRDYSAHHGALRPSQARAIASANLMFWTGEDLTPWLAPALASLSPQARDVELLATDGWEPLAGVAHSHSDEHDEHHDDHADADHEHEHEDEHNHDHDEQHTDDHAGDVVDPHAWLDPNVALAWAGTISEELSRLAPDEAAAFAANLEAFATEIAALKSEINDILAPHRGGAFVVGHDAYGYFSRAFDMAPSGAILPPGAHDVGPRGLAEVRELMADEGVACVLSDIETPSETVDLVASVTGARIVLADPEGRDPEPGPDLYIATLRALADDLADCLAES